MKKTIVLSLVAALSLTSSTAIAQAMPADREITAGDTGVQAFKAVTASGPEDFAPVEISGVIEEITQTDMKVKVRDGETYMVPLGLLSKQEGFDALGLAKGVEVSLKSMQAGLGKTIMLTAAAGPALTIKGDKADENAEVKDKDGNAVKTLPSLAVSQELEAGNVIVFSEGSVEGSQAEIKKLEPVDGVKVFMPSEVSANGKTVKLDIKTAAAAFSIISIMPAEISGTVESINESEMSVKTGDGKVYTVPLAAFGSMDEFKGLEIENGTEVSVKRQPVEKTANITGSASIAAVKIINSETDLKVGTKAELGELKEAKLVFIAHEITANGKTVKLAE